MAARDGLLEELEHVLQDLDARVEQVDPLRDLEVTPCGVIEWLQVRVRLSRQVSSVHKKLGYVRGGRTQKTSCSGREEPGQSGRRGRGGQQGTDR